MFTLEDIEGQELRAILLKALERKQKPQESIECF
jgi:hypothetical protein